MYLQQILHVNIAPESLHIRMFLAQQPTDVWEEEATLRVVRIGVRFRVAMMHAMVLTPMEHTVLQRGRLHCHQQYSQRQMCLVWSMRPEAEICNKYL